MVLYVALKETNVNTIRTIVRDPSWPDLFRPSAFLVRAKVKDVDARHEPGMTQ
jgi:hypothetical protein